VKISDFAGETQVPSCQFLGSLNVRFECLQTACVAAAEFPKRLAILLVGSDMDGKVFSEETKDCRSEPPRRPALFSQYVLSAEQELILRRLDYRQRGRSFVSLASSALMARATPTAWPSWTRRWTSGESIFPA